MRQIVHIILVCCFKSSIVPISLGQLNWKQFNQSSYQLASWLHPRFFLPTRYSKLPGKIFCFQHSTFLPAQKLIKNPQVHEARSLTAALLEPLGMGGGAKPRFELGLCTNGCSMKYVGICNPMTLESEILNLHFGNLGSRCLPKCLPQLEGRFTFELWDTS